MLVLSSLLEQTQEKARSRWFIYQQCSVSWCAAGAGESNFLSETLMTESDVTRENTSVERTLSVNITDLHQK